MTDNTPREALEREQFEKWAATQPRHEGVSMRYLTLNNAYVDYELHGAWLAWQARAALAAPSAGPPAPIAGVTAIYCGWGCSCVTQCGDTYDYAGQPKPPLKPATPAQPPAAQPVTTFEPWHLLKHRILPPGTEPTSSLHWDDEQAAAPSVEAEPVLRPALIAAAPSQGGV